MRPACNLHTHSTFCDGQNTPEEMVQAAIAQGLLSLGFSGHSFTPCDPSYCMLPESTAAYRAEILRLREVYRGKIELYLGVERDFYTDQEEYLPPYDYVIGSVHYLFKGRCCLPIDHARQTLEEAVRQLYGGDWMSLIRDYYELVARMPARVHPDIVGHFDVITKFNEGGCLFDEDSRIYQHLAMEAMDAVLAHTRLFEINTGAIARKKRTAPYPALFLLRHLHHRGGEVILNSDCHNAEYLQCAFPLAVDLARAAGFTHAKILLHGQFTDVPLE